MAMEIRLSGKYGGVALIDDCDGPLVAGRSWRRRVRAGYLPYVTAATTVRGRDCTLILHRVILGLPGGHSPEVDHINGDVLDNRRNNLRIATASQNSANRHTLAANTSGFRGVTFHKGAGKWQASVKVRGRYIYLGLFADAAEAARAYDAKALEAFGEFARPNFVRDVAA